MQWLWALCMVVVVVQCAGGVTKSPPGAAGISQFWTDDYKVFEQIYGKTSDKDLFEATLPPVSYNIDNTKLKALASEKKERYIENEESFADDDYGFGNRYNNFLSNPPVKKLVDKKPTKSPFSFIAADFKPISQNNDPETYSYLKHLEQLDKPKIEFSDVHVRGFKPFVSYLGANPEGTDNYKSIQEILEAHDANKGKIKENVNTDDQVKYLTYGAPKEISQNKKKSKASGIVKTKPRCNGRCRKRATTSYRVRTRPYVRRIKHKIISY